MGKLRRKDYPSDIKNVIIRCSRGNIKAQEHLFKYYYPYVKSIALRYSSCYEDAEEITNDSFVKIFEKIGLQDSKKDFKSWIRVITINTALDRYRKNRKHDLEIASEIYVNEPPDFTLLDSLDAEDIIGLINSLPLVYRFTFNMYVIEGFSHAEIAQKLQVTESSSRSNLTRSKKLLRQMIEKKNRYEGII